MKLSRYFFEPQSAVNLGLSRLIFFTLLFGLYLPQDFSDWFGVPYQLWSPTPFFELSDVRVFSETSMRTLGWLFKGSLLLAAIGFWTRASVLTSFLTGTYLLGIRHCFADLQHNDASIPICLFVLTFSRCGDAYSIDALLKKKPASSSAAYNWPIKVIWIQFTLVWFLAALNKLHFSGLHWMETERFSQLLVRFQYIPHYPIPTEWGLTIAEIPWLCAALPITTLVVESFMPLALISRGARFVLVPSSVAMVFGFHFLLGPFFFHPAIVAVFWIPWERLLARGSTRQPD